LAFLDMCYKGLVAGKVSPLIKKEADRSGFKIEFKDKNFPLVSRYGVNERLAFIYRVEPRDHQIVAILEAEGAEREETVTLLRDFVSRNPSVQWSDKIPGKEKFQKAVST
jgi:hypothetical protein